MLALMGRSVRAIGARGKAALAAVGACLVIAAVTLTALAGPGTKQPSACTRRRPKDRTCLTCQAADGNLTVVGAPTTPRSARSGGNVRGKSPEADPYRPEAIPSASRALRLFLPLELSSGQALQPVRMKGFDLASGRQLPAAPEPGAVAPARDPGPFSPGLALSWPLTVGQG